MHEVFIIIIYKIIYSEEQKNQSKDDWSGWLWKISSLVLMMIFEFVLTCLWDIWCYELETHVKIDFQSLSFTVWSQFHHKNHTNYWAQDDYMQQHSHSAAILTEFKKSKHIEYEDCKREITDHESNVDNNKKKNKNNETENWEEQATHTTQEQIIKILKSLIIKNQIIFKQKVIK